ncbi:carbonic anhydrase [Achromobacter sp. GG226]|uniref:carbonic anhydrase n=1 Tax=Verticiella alkaliphila TaxID=2779529 RepID=UPI001C0CB676|nr:carbonic anhydrase [Verticiella sp. GG226]MBU4610470.1 carbonic anhydrase [Verticiella sp. GG226]
MTLQPACACRDISHFIRGITDFKERNYGHAPSLMQELAHGQAPATLVISCSDSRVDPVALFGADPGELFSVRNVANMVPPYAAPADEGSAQHGVAAAVEYAVRDLKVDHIIVLGHAHCGGIKAMLNMAAGEPLPREFIGRWVRMALQACEQYVKDPADPSGRHQVSLDVLRENPALVERAAIQGSLANLMQYSWLRERVEAGNLQLHGWWFDLDTGDLWTTAPGQTHLMPVL